MTCSAHRKFNHKDKVKEFFPIDVRNIFFIKIDCPSNWLWYANKYKMFDKVTQYIASIRHLYVPLFFYNVRYTAFFVLWVKQRIQIMKLRIRKKNKRAPFILFSNLIEWKFRFVFQSSLSLCSLPFFFFFSIRNPIMD